MYESAKYSETGKEEGEGEVVILLRGGKECLGHCIFGGMYSRYGNYKYHFDSKTCNNKPTKTRLLMHGVPISSSALPQADPER